MQQEVAFLFGAGADSFYGVSNGQDFAENILSIKENNKSKQKVLSRIIKEYYSNVLKNCKVYKKDSDWYPDTYGVVDIGIDTYLKNSIKKEWLEEGKHAKTVKSFEREITKQSAKYKNKTEKLDFIFKHPNYMGILDEYFHTIISPRALGPSKFWTVITIYAKAYITICAEILDISIEEKNRGLILELLSNPTETYKKINNKIDCKKNSYYLLVKDILSNKKINVITTNYTPIAEKVLDNNEIAYIHGNLKLFESPYYLQVKDISITDYSNNFLNEINFPYLFIQSGVKPIIEKTQLQEYRKFIDYLDNSKILFILGYGFNGDDNHINSILHSYLYEKENGKRKNRIVYFDYIDKNKEETIEKLCRKMRIENVDIPSLNNANTDTVQIEIVTLDKNDALKDFENEIKKYI